MTIVVYIALIAAGLLLAGWIYQQVGERLDARRLPPRGDIRDGFHILRRGAAGPPIVLEAGIVATSLSWASVLKHLPEDRLVVAYDRLGLGWSASPTSPRTLDTLAADLLRVLDLAGVREPAILAAHSFGGLIVRRFAQLYPARTAALVLLDPLEPVEWSNLTKERIALLARGVMLSRRGILLAKIGVVRFALALLVSGARTLPKFLARASTGRSTVTDRLVGEVRKMPAEVWPAVRAHWCLPRSFATMAEYLERLPGNCRQAAAIELPASLPITIISAGNTQNHIKAAHAAYATRHIVATGSGHWVQLDDPSLAASEILRLQ
ncbi:MAG: hypothetical protein C0504_11905 [Candidatus Solibacter sp.]|nr:hypothetical protein [Candidatus Solibacter sp.]